jgi:protein-disulfide isomerase
MAFPNKLLAPAAIALALVAIALAGLALLRDSVPGIAAKPDASLEATIREYLLRNPDVVREALIELQRREEADEAQLRVAALEENNVLLYKSPRGVTVGNRGGDVAVVEFFDYNCGFCKRALADMDQLLSSDPKLMFVLKELPVLGQASVDAARVSVALRMQDADGNKYLDFHRQLLAMRGQVDGARALAIAEEIGADLARLKTDMNSKEIEATFNESTQLAQSLGINGTPSYVIADEVVPGAVGLDALKRRISAVRECGKATC